MRYMTKTTTPAKSKSKKNDVKAKLSQEQGNAACFTWLSSLYKKNKKIELSDTYPCGSMEFQPPRHQRGRRTALGAGSNRTQIHTDLAVSLSDLSHLAMVEDEALDDINSMRNGTFIDYINSRKNYMLSIVDGKIYYQDKLLNTNECGRFKFVQDRNGEIYGAETENDPEGIKHSSLMGNEWPVSAGTMSANDGELNDISNSSGHFRPGQTNLNATVSFLKKRDVVIYNVSPFFGGNNVRRLSISSPVSFRKKFYS
ncbi:hypothetical protein [Serratia marcescens]|uniref:hypothetical protein n=1 Tax=Serratia marcescens TaxID=615 RepID=UPI0027E3C651|nr:hypothetical protein [Serratia marcescens]MCS3413236.1 hypothetical protein [Serratia marcescens]BEN27489.1 hypothetical protein SMKC032_35840 [Serratia marcescens]